MAYENQEIFPSHEKGNLGVMHLKRYWSKLIAKRNHVIAHDAFKEEWNTDITLLNVVGVGLQPTLEFIFSEQPSFETFERWIAKNGRLSDDKITGFNQTLNGKSSFNATDQLSEYILSTEDLDFWKENGYLIIRNAVPVADCKAVIDTMCKFLKIDLSDPKTWYTPSSEIQGIWVPLYQHPTLQKNRESSRIQSVYEQLWGRRDLWVNTDRLSFNPPETDTYHFSGPWLHWDVSLELPIPFGLQGLLYLSDTATNQGAFTVVPGFHNHIAEWLMGLPEGVDPRNEDLYALGAKAIAANAGDFIVWHHALPHGSSPNTSGLPRMAQYINYRPADFEVRDKWK